MTTQLLVKDIFDKYKMNSLIINEDEKLFESIVKFAQQPELKSIFVVNIKKKV